MKFKLDENLDVRLKAIFAEANLDADTVVDESMQRAVEPDRIRVRIDANE